MATMTVKDANGVNVDIEKPLAPGRMAAAVSRPVALSNEDFAVLDGLETLITSTNTLVTSTNTKLDTVHTDLGSATPAGANLIGKVKTKFVAALGTALARPANQTPYTANDSISNNATAGSVTANSITVTDLNDEPVAIEAIRLLTNDTGIRGKAVRVWLYNSDPTANSGVVGGDNAAFSNKVAGSVGSFSGTFSAATGAFSDGAIAVLVPDQAARRITAPTTGARTIFWQLQTLEDFTPGANSTTFTPTVEGFQGAA